MADVEEKVETGDTEIKPDAASEEKEGAEADKDYEAELKAERERANAAEAKLEETRQKAKERMQRKKEGDSEDVDESEADVDKPLTARQLDERFAAERQHTEKQMQAVTIVELAGKLASSDTEKQLIIEIHKNRVFPAGMSLNEQMEEAYVLANKKRFPALLSEAKRAMRSKDTATDSATGTHRDPAPTSEPKVSSAEATALRGAGFVWDGTQRMWKKPLKGGQFLFRDPKTGKTFKK